MDYRFVFTAWFDRNLKSLRKHNPSLRGDFESFLRPSYLEMVHAGDSACPVCDF